MKRDHIFKNVSFGGGWSERIIGVEQRMEALNVLKAAIEDTIECDIREDAYVLCALCVCTDRIPRGEMIHQAWIKALSLPNPNLRSNELARLCRLIELGLGTSAKL